MCASNDNASFRASSRTRSHAIGGVVASHARTLLGAVQREPHPRSSASTSAVDCRRRKDASSSARLALAHGRAIEQRSELLVPVRLARIEIARREIERHRPAALARQARRVLDRRAVAVVEGDRREPGRRLLRREPRDEVRERHEGVALRDLRELASQRRRRDLVVREDHAAAVRVRALEDPRCDGARGGRDRADRAVHHSLVG